MVFFLTHVEPLHPLRGKEALFFIREQSESGHKTHVVTKDIPHYFFTPRMSPEEAYYIAELLEHDRSLEHLVITQHQHSPHKHYVRAEGSKEDQHYLSEPFLCKGALGNRDPLGLNSPSRLLRWLYPPFLLLASATPEGIPEPEEMLQNRNNRNYVTSEQVLADSYAVLDIEVRNWQTGNDQIFMVVYLCPAKNQKIIYHDFDQAGLEYGEVQLQHFSSQEELGQLLTQRVQEDDPLWEMGHNLMNYDRLQLRNITEEYFPAANHHYPITKSAQGLGRVQSKGRFTVDTYTYAFNYQSLFADNKLSTHARFGKSASYAELDQLEKEARAGSRKSLEQLLHYTIEDGLHTEQLGLQLRERVAIKARHFRRDPDSVCSVGKVTLANDSWNRKYFMIKSCYRDSWKRQREEETFSVENYKEEFIGAGFTPGFLDEVHILYLTPFITGCLPLFGGTIQDLLRAFQHSKTPLEKFDWLQTINAKVSYFVEETEKILQWEGSSLHHPSKALSQKQQQAFYSLCAAHGMKGIEPLALIESMIHSLHKTQDVLEQYDIINRGTHLYALRGNIDIRSLEEKFYGCYLGEGKVLSLREGRFVANPFHETMPARYIYQGFHTNAGQRSNFEKRTLQQLVELMFRGELARNITTFLNREQVDFITGKKPTEDYHITQKTRTYYRNILESIFERRANVADSSITKTLAQEYISLKHRIGDRYSEETQRELWVIISQCRNDFSYPYILETMERIEHPFPAKVNLVYALGLPAGELMPESIAAALDFLQYKYRVQELFHDFYDILQPQQQQLFPLGQAVGKVRQNKKCDPTPGKSKQLSLAL